MKKILCGNSKKLSSKVLSFILIFVLTFLPIFTFFIDSNLAFANTSLNLSDPYLGDTPKQVLKGQIVWADFTSGTGNSTATNVDNLGGGRIALKMGSVLTINVTDDYIVRAEVAALKPFDASDEYKDRVEGTGDEGSYRPNATNTNQKRTQPRRIIIDRQSPDWSNISQSGFNTGNRINSISTDKNKPNAGVTFKITATYKGVPVKPNIVIADSEESGDKEVQTVITKGEPWELIANVANNSFTDLQPIKVLSENDLNTPDGSGGYTPDSFETLGYIAKYWVSPDQTNAGLGTNVFGPVNTDFKAWGSEPVIHRGVPIIMSRETEEVSIYFNVTGYQSAMMGFVVIDEGDAPDSYGRATHMIRQTDNIKQPFIGKVKADLDEKELQTGDYWVRDDVSNNTDEGAQQLMGDEAHQNSDGSYTYTLHRAQDGNYKLKILADPNTNAQAFVKGWVDFNNNGKFDTEEGSAVETVTSSGEIELNFANVFQRLGDSVDQIGMRVRIAKIKDNIIEPKGDAFSGEVEDFKIHVTYPPRGEKKTTTGLQGETQSAKINFTAYGKRDYNFTVDNEIDDTYAVQIVKPDGTLANTYTESGEGTYTVAADGTVTFDPLPTFLGTAKGVVLRSQDKNSVTTGWTSNEAQSGVANINNGVNGMNTMDGVYIPTVIKPTPTGDNVTSTGPQGVEQTKKVTFNPGNDSVPMDNTVPATFEDGSTQKVIPGEGKYVVSPDGTVTFTPEPDFVGEGTLIKVKRVDVNGTEAIGTFKATVTEVKPTGEDVISEGEQGDVQSKKVNFTPGDDSVPMDNTVPATFEDGSTTKTIPNEGTYTVAADGTVTFEPVNTFHGEGTVIKVIRKDVNGTEATGTFKAIVNKPIPSGEDVTSEGKQGIVQSKKVNFTPGNENVPMDDTVNATFENGSISTVIPGEGQYDVSPDGTVKFTPEEDFVGEGTKLVIKRVDINGTQALGTFKAIVIGVKPTGEDVTSEGAQGEIQSKKVGFIAGDEEVPMDESVPATFDDGTTQKVIPGEGKYEVSPDGTVTFTPELDFVGEGTKIKVVRKDINGTEAVGTFKAKVNGVKVEADDVNTTGYKGKEQNAKVVFKNENGDVIKISTENPVKFFVNGVLINDTDIPAFKDGKVVGKYILNPATGDIKFVPDADFVGKPEPVLVAMLGANNKIVAAKYQPNVIAQELPATGTSNMNIIYLILGGLIVIGGIAILFSKKKKN